MPFALIAYLGFRGGGYEVVVRSEVGLLIWLVIAALGVTGVIPLSTQGRTGRLLLAVFAAFTVWTGLAVIWSESAERSAIEVARVATLLGIFALALATQTQDSLRRAAIGIAAAISLISILALLSRFEPNWFPPNDVAEFLPSEQDRLNYPLTYWNALATLVAMGVPLLLWAAVHAPRIWWRAGAAATLPALALTLNYTISRGGVAEVALALVVFVAVHPRRLSLLPPLGTAAAGSAGLIAAAEARGDLSDGLLSPAAATQGDEMLALTIVICLAVGLISAAVEAGMARKRIELPQIGRRRAGIATLAVAATVLVAGLIAGAPGEFSDRWSEFKQPVNPGSGSARLDSVSGSGRYQWWESAVDANATDPVLGIGPGTWEYWWARGDGGIAGFVRDAHSLYLETLGELGIVGFILIVSLIGGVLAIGTSRVLQRRERVERTALLAATLAAATAFAAAAAVDWAWEMTVLPATFLILAAGLVGTRGANQGRSEPEPGGRRAGRLLRPAAVIIAVVAGVAIALPMLSTAAVEDSKSAVDRGDLVEALVSARRADDRLPLAASPNLQQALVLQLGGELEEAAAQAERAAADEPTNWRNWLVLAQVEQQLGRTEEAAADYERAQSLNPRSPLLSSPNVPSSPSQSG